MKRLITLLIFIFTGALVYGQTISRLGRFSVDNIRGCAPFTVNIISTNLITVGECTPSKPCLMDYQGNNSQQQNLFVFIYNTPGTYKLSVLYQSIGADDITITVDPNIQPNFEIYTCSANQVSIKITDINYNQYQIDFGDGAIIPFGNSKTAQHSYLAAGNYNISVTGRRLGAAQNCNSKVLPFQALLTLPLPQITQLTAIDPTTLKLDFVQQVNIQYHLEIAVNSTNFQLLQTLYGVSTYTIPNLKVDDNYYCFRLSSYDPCTGVNNYSNQVCSHNFDLTLTSGQNKLDWQTSVTGVASVDVLRNKTIYNSLPGSPLTFSDQLVICKTSYCYQLTSNYSSGTKSISLEKCGTAFSSVTPNTINNTTSIVSKDGVQLSWLQDPLFKSVGYTLYQSQNQGTFFLHGQSPTAQYQVPGYNASGNFCYAIQYKDECDNQSQLSSPVCPIRLQASLADNNEVTLTWSDYRGWVNGVKNYKIEKFNKSGGLINTFTTIGSITTLLDNQLDLQNQAISYKVTAIPNDASLVSSVSNQVDVVKQVNLFFPTAFTPDKVGPPENETFAVGGQFISKLEMSIFDRWGALIFYSDKNEPWDGTRSGQPMPVATYVWTVNITDLTGQSSKRSGTVLLMRK